MKNEIVIYLMNNITINLNYLNKYEIKFFKFKYI